MTSKVKKSKSDKSKKKLESSSSSDTDDESEHELSYYINDRIKLMKQITKILKPKKIKSMAPDCYKKLDIADLNSMLLEELLGISNKRLKHIISGQSNLEYSSSDTDDNVKSPDVISLDDISTDEDLTLIETDPQELIATPGKKSKKHKKNKQIKAESHKVKKEKLSPPPGNSKETDLMNVLELLELQARARAIRSQLALEAENKKKTPTDTASNANKEDSDPEAVILNSPKQNEIVISSSESDNDTSKDTNKAIRLKESQENNIVNEPKESTATPVDEKNEGSEVIKEKETDRNVRSDSDNEGIVLNVDIEREEIDKAISS